jgi:ATP-dependent DNA ligase
LAQELPNRLFCLASGIGENEIEKRLKKLGDLGTVAFKMDTALEKQVEGFPSKENVTVKDLHRKFIEIARAKGVGSQESKTKNSG